MTQRTGQLNVYRSCSPVVDSRYELDDSRSVVDALAEAVASAEGVDVTDLPPLYDVIDLDAITQLFEDHHGAVAAEAFLGFTYDHWNVFIRADGCIRVCDGRKYVDPEPVFDDVSV